MKHLGCNKFKFDHTNSKWIDVDCIIYTMTISFNSPNEIYPLKRIDVEELEKFVIE